MSPHAERLLLSVYALEVMLTWDDSRYETLDEIYKYSRTLRGTKSSAFARAVINGRRIAFPTTFVFCTLQNSVAGASC